MTGAEWAALAAVVLAAVSVLPGTLGILMFTNRIAASVPGAKYIYGKALWVFAVSVLCLLGSVIASAGGPGVSLLLAGAWTVYAGICVFGFFMHTRFMFRPVRRPRFVPIDEAIARFGPEEEVVGVIDGNGTPYAFIARLARRPHIVYQPAGDAPFIMTHCILSHSSMAYAMTDRFRDPDIVITAALANNMVFFEKRNQCSVVQLHNASRDQSLPLATMPTVACSLGTWKTLYPHSQVWLRSREWRDVFYLKLLARADVIDPASPVMVYPLQHPADERLPLKEQVIGVAIGGESKAYPVSLFAGGDTVLNDELGGTPICLVSAAGGDFIQVYDRRAGGTTLSFRPGPGGDELTDAETGSRWRPQGHCVAGEHEGSALLPVPHYNKIFWYVWADYHPGTRLHGEETDAKTPAQAASAA